MTRSLALLLTPLTALLLLVGCSGKDGDTGPFAPATGEWAWDNVYAATVDDCNLFSEPLDTADPEDRFTISDNGDGTFTVVDPDEEEDLEDIVLTCTLSGTTFSCEPAEQINNIGQASLTLAATYSGSFSSSVALTADSEGTVDCEGSDCEGIADYLGTTFPCAFSGSQQAFAL
jgi:hypothetical protein